MAAMLALLAPAILPGQVPLTNGLPALGVLTATDGTDSWTFSAKPGDGIFLRVGATNFTPRIRLFDPGNALVQDVIAGNAFARDGFLTAQATNAGTYTVLISANYAGQTGGYALYLAQAPAAFSVSSADEGGLLANGASAPGTITLGDLDLWRFTANAGDGLMIRVGSPVFTPWIRLYGPDGKLAGETTSGNTFARDGFLTLQATNAGDYTVVVSAAYAGQTGNYTLHVAKAPGVFVVSAGEQGGPLVNGTANPGTISLGGLQLWSFSAQAGDGLMLRMGATNVTPWIRLYGPDGKLAGETISGNAFARDGFLTLQATNAGTYTVVVSAVYAGQAGDYVLHLAQAPGAFAVSPGEQGGSLTNGISNPGTISLGALEMWSFTARTGEGIFLRVGATNFTPWIRLYTPNGMLADETKSGNSFAVDGFLTLPTTNAGTYTVVVSASYAGQSGNYAITLALATEPIASSAGHPSGPLTNAFTVPETFNVGDLAVWSFVGTVGDSNALRVVTTNFTPWIRLYGPTGALLGETTTGNSFARTGLLTQTITNSGIYTVVLSATYAGQSGSFAFKQSRVPPDLVVPDTASIVELSALNVSVSAQDPDEPVKPLVFKLLSAPPGITINLTSATNATLSWATTETDGPSTNVITLSVSDTVNGTVFTRTNSFTVVVNEVNLPPQLVVPPNQVINELTPLNVSASASDPDLPANPLTFSLLAPPAGMSIDSNTGAIAWTPTEAQGPSTNLVTVVVTDANLAAVNAQHLSATNSFTVMVTEVNAPPQLVVPSNQVINELIPLNVSASASDPDLPANPLTFSLLAPPTGMSIDSNTGAIAWTPTEAQGPSTNLVTVVVTDANLAAVNAQHLSATNSFTVMVTEVNAPPQLVVPSNQVINELIPLNVSASASDPDLPANPLTFSLLAPPAGMSIDPNTGAIAWTPTEAQGPSTNLVTVVVTDANLAAVNAQHLSATNSFTVVVNEVNTPPTLQSITNQSLHYGVPLAIQARATDGDIPTNTLIFSLDMAPTNMTITASGGLVSWTPAQSQVGTYSITVRVTDNGQPPLSATTSFQIAVAGQGSRLDILRPLGGLTQLSITGDTGYNYELQKSTNLLNWDRLLDFTLSSSPYPYIDPEPQTNAWRFYRLKLVQ
jgi:hypothetical protein